MLSVVLYVHCTLYTHAYVSLGQHEFNRRLPVSPNRWGCMSRSDKTVFVYVMLQQNNTFAIYFNSIIQKSLPPNNNSYN